MIRHILTLSVVAVLAAVVGGQSPRALQPKERAELFKKNQLIIEKLVEKTVESSHTPNDHLKRVSTYYEILHKFNVEIRQANTAGDKARVAELTAHLSQLLDKGLSPTLKQDRLQVENGTGAEDYVKVKNDLLAQFEDLYAALGEGSPSQARYSQVESERYHGAEEEVGLSSQVGRRAGRTRLARENFQRTSDAHRVIASRERSLRR